MATSTDRVVVGLDNGGNVNNATVLDTSGQFLVDVLIESPSRVREGPDIAIDASGADIRRCLGTYRHPKGRGPRGWAGYARPGQRRGNHLVEGLNKLLPLGMA